MDEKYVLPDGQCCGNCARFTWYWYGEERIKSKFGSCSIDGKLTGEFCGCHKWEMRGGSENENGGE